MAKKEWDFEPFDIMGQDTEPKQNKDIFALKNPLLEEDEDETFDEPLLDMGEEVFQIAKVEEEEDDFSDPVFDIMNGDQEEEVIEEKEETAQIHEPEISPFDMMSDAPNEYVREEEFEEETAQIHEPEISPFDMMSDVPNEYVREEEFEEETETDDPLDVMNDDEQKKEAFLKAVKWGEEKETVTTSEILIKEIPAIEKDEEATVLKNAFSTVKKDNEDGEIFKTLPKSTTPSFERYDTSDFAPRRTPTPITRNTTSAKIIKGIAVCAVCIMTLIIVWLEGGRAYIEKSNETFFEKMRSGEDLTLTNPDFAFFLTLDEAEINLPVINSVKTSEFKSFDGKFLYPGTVVTAQSGLHTIITGAPALLGNIADVKIQSITLQDGEKTVKYEVYASHKCDELLRDVDPLSDTLTIYVKLSSGDGEVYALHAKRAQ